MCAQTKERMRRPDMKTGGHEKKKADVCKGEKDEKGTKWRGREPMKPNLVRNTWVKLVYM